MSTIQVDNILTTDGLDNFGKIVQVQHQYFTTQTSTTATSYTNLGSVQITPTRTNSSILVIMNYHISGKGDLRVDRNGTPLYTPTDGYFNWVPDGQAAWNSSSLRRPTSNVLMDFPNTTATRTYTVQMRAYQASGAQSIGVNELTVNQNYCILVCMELAQ